MSEIQAIATNNYLLATQQEVSHDNSLSGNGTVDSPLGVVPGYNETVLYSGFSTTTLTLSENPKNFERIKVITKINNNNPTTNFGAGSVCEFYTDYNMNAVCITGMFAGNPTSGAPTVFHYITNWTGTSTTEWTRTYYGFRSVTATGAYSTNGSWYTPFIIIGINRKENV